MPRLHVQENFHCVFKSALHSRKVLRSAVAKLTYSTEYLNDLATAIGRAVIEWNRVEYGLIDLGTRLGGCLCPDTVSEWRVLYIAFVNMDLRARVATVKAYASICGIPGDYYSRVERIMNNIEGPLQIERNRFFHDHWDMDPGSGPSRTTFKSRVTRPQSRTIKLEMIGSKEYSSLEEVNDFSERLKLVYLDVSALGSEACLSPQYQAALKTKRTN